MFGYTLSNYNGVNPDHFELCSKRVDITEGYNVQYNVTEEWNDGLQGEIVITNTSEEPLEAWELSFDSTFEINNLWDGRIISAANGRYVVASEMWSNPIAASESITIGFTGSKLTEEVPDIGNYSISSVVISYSLHETPLLDKLIISAYGGYIPETDTIDVFWTSTEPEGIFEVMTSNDNVEYNIIESVTNADSYSIPASQAPKYIKIRQTAKKQTAESHSFVVTKTENGFIVDYIDTDNDGIYDYIEKVIGSDLTNTDTDSDGLSDYDEFLLTNSDPTMYNSLNEALSDSEADCDEDGVSNKAEIENSTNPLLDDSDGDELNDGKEAGLGTDPLNADTDGDGANDGWEAENGYDPLVFNELFEITKSSEGENISVSVETSLGGGQIESLEISEVTESPFLNETTPGYIGSAFDFSVNGDIGEAIISFTFDEALLGDDFIPAVYYFNEDTQLLEELETTIDGNTARAKTTHFSQYILLNKPEFEESEVKVSGTLERFSTDIVFVIDNSGSMANNDPSCLRKLLTKEFITNLSEGDKASIIRFNSSYTLLCNLTDNKDELLSAADKITSGYGNTNGSNAINRALTVLNYSEATNKAIIFLTDGKDTSQSYSYADLMNKAADNEIRIYTIALGNADEVLLNGLAGGTGGKFYSAASSVDLSDIYESIQDDTIDRSLDSNNDGISDYYTKLICESKLRLGTGTEVFPVDLPYEKINADTDGDYDDDGLKNGDEITVEINETTGKVYIKMTSYPLLDDSDGDGLLDGSVRNNIKGEVIAPRDEKPLKYDGPRGVWKNHIKLSCESNAPTELTGWYGYTNPEDLSNSGFEGFEAFVNEFEYLLNNGQLAINLYDDVNILGLGLNCFVFTLASLSDMGQNVQNNLYLNIAKQSFNSMMSLLEKQIIYPENKKVIMASLGSRLLNFKADSNDNVHSQKYTWQSIGGYNNIYDNVFREYTNYNMDNEKFPFLVGDTQYILWIWRGDYLNIGAGAEMGIYSRPDWLTLNPDGIDQYFSNQDFTLPMDLYLYNYENGRMEEILSWNPDAEQWWITAFNPEHIGMADVHKQVLIGNVTFKSEDMYLSFKNDITKKEYELLDFLVHDDKNCTVWVCWYAK